MRGTGRIILGIFGFCSLVMFYVHLQVVTFLASYDIQRVSEKIHSSSEELRRLKFEVEQFKAPHLLEGKLNQYDMNLSLPQMVYHVPQSFEEIRPTELPASAQPSGFPQVLKQFVNSWVQVAHAKNDSES